VIVALAWPSAARADAGDRWDGGTASAVFQGEAIGLGVGGAVGAIAGLVVMYARDRHDKEELLFPLLGFAVVGAVGIPVGAQIGGDEAGGTGAWWGTALGELGGLAAIVGIVSLAKTTDNEAATRAGLIATIAALAVGPFLGYELTSDADASSTARIAPLWSAAF
jgi:hypothetical protein